MHQKGVRRKLTLVLAALGMSCTATATYTNTSGRPAMDLPSSCPFVIRTTIPYGRWEEIGVINLLDISMTGQAPYSVDDFAKLIAADVCRAGGQLVVGDVNGRGQYIRGTVFVKGDVTGPSANDGTAESTVGTGCLYDVQCKSDRICEQGRCVDPPVEKSAVVSPGCR